PNVGRAGTLPLAPLRGRRPFRAFPWQAVGQPIHLPGNVIKDLREAQAFEPRRGPVTEVSLRVMAVDNDGLVLLERCACLAIELLQRDIDRPGQVLCFIPPRRQALYKPRPTCHHATHLVALNLHWHTLSPFPFTALGLAHPRAHAAPASP